MRKPKSRHQLEAQGRIARSDPEDGYLSWAGAYESAQKSLKVALGEGGKFWTPAISVGCSRMSLLGRATYLTIQPRTRSCLKESSLPFDSVWDALGSDWFKVGSDLYQAIQKSRISLSRAGLSAEKSPSSSYAAK